MYFYLLLEVDGQEARLDLPRVVPGAEEEGAYAPVRWEARYVTRVDTPTGDPAVLVFLDLETAVYYAGRLLADGSDVAIVTTSDGEIQERAFGGTLEACASWTPQPNILQAFRWRSASWPNGCGRRRRRVGSKIHLTRPGRGIL